MGVLGVLLIIVGILVGLSGCGTLVLSTTAIHQIQGCILWLIAVVLFVGGFIP
jgi:hypothetical protein